MVSRSRFRGAAVVVILVLVTAGATSVVAADGQSSADAAVEQIGQQEIVITDAQVTVSGISVSGPTLPSIDIHDRTYTIQDASVTVDGLTTTYNGQTYEICSVSIVLDDISVTLKNIHIGTK